MVINVTRALTGWQTEGKHFVCRIKSNTTKTCLDRYEIADQSYIRYDAKVLLGQVGTNHTQTPLRLVGYHVAGKKTIGLPPTALI